MKIHEDYVDSVLFRCFVGEFGLSDCMRRCARYLERNVHNLTQLRLLMTYINEMVDCLDLS